ncbi:MAG TPA: O-antigen ligase family protein [Solirubrobacterales bacterium]|nr:O-antigen ligase family protein [Solirubrobacterales bacterium]
MLVSFVVAFWSGGFGDPARLALVLAGAVGLLASALRSPESLASAFRSLPVAGLLGLTLVGAISLAWTRAGVQDAAMIAMIPAAYAGLVVFAAGDPMLRRRRDLVGIWLAALAVISAITGLIGVMFEIGPWAIWLGGRLRPAGVVEYPPALALLQLGAMPVLARGWLGGKNCLWMVAGGSLIIGSSIILLAQSRVVLFLACVLIAVWLAWPERSLGVNRTEAMWAVLLWLTGGLLVTLGVQTFDSWPAAILCVLVLLAVPRVASNALDRLRRAVPVGVRSTGPAVAAIVLIGLMAAGAAAVLLASPGLTDQGMQADQGFDHGRVELWRVSANAASEEPLLGHGQGAFLETTIEEQDSPVRFAHSLVLESAVETGIPGALLACLVLVGSMACCWKRRLDFTAWLYIPMVFGFSALALVDWTWHLTGIGAAWALCLGCLLMNRPDI